MYRSVLSKKTHFFRLPPGVGVASAQKQREGVTSARPAPRSEGRSSAPREHPNGGPPQAAREKGTVFDRNSSLFSTPSPGYI